jgi:hypothetical protein
MKGKRYFFIGDALLPLLFLFLFTDVVYHEEHEVHEEKLTTGAHG